MKTELDNSLRTSSKQDSNIHAGPQQDKDAKIATPLSRYLKKKKKLQSKAVFHFVKHELCLIVKESFKGSKDHFYWHMKRFSNTTKLHWNQDHPKYMVCVSEPLDYQEIQNVYVCKNPEEAADSVKIIHKMSTTWE